MFDETDLMLNIESVPQTFLTNPYLEFTYVKFLL